MKRFQSIGTLLSAITIVLAVVLVSTFTVSALGAYEREVEARMVLSVVTGARTIMSPMIALRAETGLANLALEAPEAGSGATLLKFQHLHAQTECALNTVLHEIEQRRFGDAKLTWAYWFMPAMRTVACSRG